MADRLTTMEAASLLKCREATVRKYIELGLLSATRVRRRWLIARESVIRLVGCEFPIHLGLLQQMQPPLQNSAERSARPSPTWATPKESV